ncbi:hypothetical protein B0G57_12527 [Trinickia symbiotica]|uniref:Uncharacterized protein n=1 Tax=Trinickia symbiotica TaxID=863227 RepID=A0A2N7WTI5_9BURK|nr:hypothetical protein [Trinickia symbiotica]PMS32651.1 hypothetical protein C0Z20_26145 [Trinickia symbiotica]PPK41762.1 hypothetical protein B0G57_12527 [Trinickia symbiotica]
MARLDDLREELEQLGREIEEEVLRERSVRDHVASPSRDTPIRIELDITPNARHRLQISITMQPPDDDGPP